MKICYYIIFAFFFLQKSSAQTESYCGMCGDSISYSFSNSVLTLEGHGKMYNYVSKPTPWFSIKDSVKKLVVKDGITELGNIAESPFTNLKEVELCKTLVYIGEHWFAECDSLESIVIPENVQSVGWGLFFMCRNLKNVDWKCKASFEGQTFADTSLRKFYVPEGVKFLGLQCFGWCKNLEYLEIPSSVDSISSEIIHGCFNLKSLVIRRKTPPQIREFAFHRGRSLSGGHFEPIYLQGVRLLVPKESVELYKREWGKYVEEVFAIEDEEYCDSKIVENKQIVNSSESSFTVKKVKKLKNDVYVIYANRNDSIFKIVSYYDKKNKRGKKLTKGMRFEVSLQSVFGDFEREYKIIQPCNLSMEFHGVAVGKELENGIDDVWFCEELNGPYLTRELQNTTRCEVRKVNTYKKIVEYEVTLPKGTKKNTRSAEFGNSAERKIGNL